ncbi:MAG: ATP-dependent endonuclease [Acidimicrobiia bacterium]|nr:ATP-dependent endonuclease [Acidimicrobiia bacterium]
MRPAVILVEGPSDQAAIETLARRRGRDLRGENVHVVPMGGAYSLASYLHDLHRRHGPEIGLAGLCDEGEETAFAHGLEVAGLGTGLTREAMEQLGFFVCVTDLEDELIRSLGPDVVLSVIESAGELGKFRVFQNQPEWRDGDLVAQLRRFLGIRSGRKTRYGRLLVEALDLERVPLPLEGVLAAV